MMKKILSELIQIRKELHTIRRCMEFQSDVLKGKVTFDCWENYLPESKSHTAK